MEAHVVASSNLSDLNLLVTLSQFGTLLALVACGRGATHHFLRHVLVSTRALVGVSQLLVNRVLVWRLGST